MIEFFKELRRRKVWLFGGIYLAMAWVLLEVAMALEATLALPDWVDKVVLVLLCLGFPVTLLLAWAQESRVSTAEPDGDKSPVFGASQGRNRASIVILPFTCLLDDRGVEILADSLTEDLTTLLGRVPELYVIARNTAYSYKGKNQDLRAVGNQLEVRYALEGSLRKHGENLRITSQLIETQTGTHLWAGKHDVPMGEFVATSDELTQTMAMEICSEITRAEATLANQSSKGNEDAQACLQKARASLLFRGWSKKSFSETINLLRRAIELDPDLAPAHAYLALLLAIGGQAYYAADRKAAHDEALEAAERALDLAPESSEVLGCIGCAYSDIGFHEKGIPIIEKAIEIDSTNAQAFAALGAAKIVTLDIENGVRDLEHAIRLSPTNVGIAIWKATLSIGQTVLGNHSAAYEMAQQACRDDPRYYPGYIAMALVHVKEGRMAEAQKAMGEAQRILPDLDRTKVRNYFGAWTEQTLREAGISIPEQQCG